MNRYLLRLLLLSIVYLLYRYKYPTKATDTMSDNDNNKRQEDIGDSRPEDLLVDFGGKQVPFSKINKPHNVILDPNFHQPKVNAESFPDIEPEAKKREEDAETRRKAAHKYILDPYAHKPQVNAEQFPEVEPEVEKTVEKVRAARQKKDE